MNLDFDLRRDDLTALDFPNIQRFFPSRNSDEFAAQRRVLPKMDVEEITREEAIRRGWIMPE